MGYLSVFFSMVGALLVAWFWLMKDGALAEAWKLSKPDDMRNAVGIAAAATGAIIGIFAVGGPAMEASASTRSKWS